MIFTLYLDKNYQIKAIVDHQEGDFIKGDYLATLDCLPEDCEEAMSLMQTTVEATLMILDRQANLIQSSRAKQSHGSN